MKSVDPFPVVENTLETPLLFHTIRHRPPNKARYPIRHTDLSTLHLPSRRTSRPFSTIPPGSAVLEGDWGFVGSQRVNRNGAPATLMCSTWRSTAPYYPPLTRG